jgi:hypothetical protein
MLPVVIRAYCIDFGSQTWNKVVDRLFGQIDAVHLARLAVFAFDFVFDDVFGVFREPGFK